jgi:predicted dehydrogenase
MAIEGRSDSGKGGRIRLGMVGGGEGAFIGTVHRIASRLDDHYELVAGALSSTPDKARRSGEALGLAADRMYDDYESMAEAEAKRSGGIDAVAIATPNHMHAGRLTVPIMFRLNRGVSGVRAARLFVNP